MLVTPPSSFLDDCAILNDLEEFVIDLMSCSALVATPFLLLTKPILNVNNSGDFAKSLRGKVHLSATKDMG